MPGCSASVPSTDATTQSSGPWRARMSDSPLWLKVGPVTNGRSLSTLEGAMEMIPPHAVAALADARRTSMMAPGASLMTDRGCSSPSATDRSSATRRSPLRRFQGLLFTPPEPPAAMTTTDGRGSVHNRAPSSERRAR